MTATNPHPLANPLNQGRFRNYAYGQQPKEVKPFVRTSSNPSELTVPDPVLYNSNLENQFDQNSFFGQNSSNRLTVPNQDIPYYNGPIPARGFLGESPLFKLSDGSIVDLKQHRVVFDPSAKWKDKGYWNDPNSTSDTPNNDKEWGKTESIESMLNRVGNPDGTYEDPNLSPESIRYWKMAREESKKLEQNLTDEQKNLLDALQSGKIFPLSKLVDEND